METTRKYSTDTYTYYRKLIDMQVGWVEFLLSFGKIGNNKEFDLDAKLAEIRLSLGKELDDFLDKKDSDDAKEVYLLIKKTIIEKLNNSGLESISNFIGYGLDDEEFANFITLVYIREYVKSLTSELRQIDNLVGYEDDGARALKMLIDKLTKLTPEAYLKSNIFNESLMDFYFGDVSIRYGKNGDINAYLYMVIMLLDRINLYICYMLPSKELEDALPVSQGLELFDEQMYLESPFTYNVDNLIKTLENLRHNVLLMKSLLQSNDVGRKLNLKN